MFRMGRWAALLFSITLAASAQDDCRAHVKAGDEAKARDCYLDAAKAATDRRVQADALYQAGRSQYALGDTAGSLKTYSQALELRRASGDQKEQGSLLNNMASSYWTLGEFAKALEHYQLALPLREASGDKFGAALTQFGMANVHSSWGDFEGAIRTYNAALAVFRELKAEPYQADVLNAAGLSYASLGEFSKAESHYNDALVLWRRTKLRGREAYTLNNLGLLEIDRKNPSKALPYFEQAGPMLADTRDNRGRSYVLNNEGDAYAALKQPKRALDLYASSLALKRTLGDQFGEARTLESMGEALAASGDNGAALERLGEALALYRRIGGRPGEAVTLAAFARVKRSGGELAGARQDIEQALATIESLRAQLSSTDLRTSFFGTQQDYYAFYVDLLMSMNEPGAALEANERSRARGLLDMLGEARINPSEGIAPELIERRRTLARELRALAQRGGSKRLDDALREWNDLDATIRKTSRSEELLQPDILRAADLDPAFLTKDTVLLEYGVAEQRSFAWLVTPTGIHSAVLPGRSVLEALARRGLTALDARNQHPRNETAEARGVRIRIADASFERVAGELGRILLGPFERRFGTAKIVVVPDGPLHYVPFAALRLPATRRRLIATHEVSRAPSASIVQALRQQRHPKAQGMVVAVADPVYDLEDARISQLRSGRNGVYNRLRFSRSEAESIVRLGGPTSRSLIDFAATREAILSNALRNFRIVHFATHAEIDNDHPALSRIILSQVDAQGRPRDGALRLFEIFNLKLDADLVVLSACRSALGPNLRGEGLMGLTRGFLYAGASSVVASLWDVEDRATSVLMKAFYEPMLIRKATPIQALRQAQLKVSADPRWASPYYWAAFSLQGDWR